FGQLLALAVAEVAGVAEGVDIAGGGDQPVPVPGGGRRHRHHRLRRVGGDVARGTKGGRVAERRHLAVGRRQPAPTPSRCGRAGAPPSAETVPSAAASQYPSPDGSAAPATISRLSPALAPMPGPASPCEDTASRPVTIR